MRGFYKVFGRPEALIELWDGPLGWNDMVHAFIPYVIQELWVFVD